MALPDELRWRERALGQNRGKRIIKLRSRAGHVWGGTMCRLEWYPQLKKWRFIRSANLGRKTPGGPTYLKDYLISTWPEDADLNDIKAEAESTWWLKGGDFSD